MPETTREALSEGVLRAALDELEAIAAFGESECGQYGCGAVGRAKRFLDMHSTEGGDANDGRTVLPDDDSGADVETGVGVGTPSAPTPAPPTVEPSDG